VRVAAVAEQLRALGADELVVGARDETLLLGRQPGTRQRRVDGLDAPEERRIERDLVRGRGELRCLDSDRRGLTIGVTVLRIREVPQAYRRRVFQRRETRLPAHRAVM
jgi:hypothetical protein